jgi:MGT family glycosyltransferase
MYATNIVLDDLVQEIQSIKPDLIIHDGLCFRGKCVAQITKIPAISSISICLFTIQAISFRAILKELFSLRIQDIKYLIQANIYQNKIIKKYHLNKKNIIDTFINASELNIVYTSRDFQPLEKNFDSIHYKFVGPSLYTQTDDTIDYSALTKPIIYISLGTILNDNISFYNNCIVALKDWQGTIIMSVGEKTDIKKFSQVTPNIIIRNRVNQVELLKYVDIFITHGGMNSTQE